MSVPDSGPFLPGEIIPLSTGLYYVTRYFTETVNVPDGQGGVAEIYKRGIIGVIQIVEFVNDINVDQNYFVYGRLYNNEEIMDVVYDGSYIRSISLNAVKLAKSILDKNWDNTTIIDHSGYSTFSLSLQYLPQLLDENPLGQYPLDAIELIAASMRCYIFFNKQGQLVLQRKTESAISSGTVRTLNLSKKKSGGKKKYFWDKLCDAVTVNVQSGKTADDGTILTGTATVKKYPGIQPRNELTIEVVAPDNVEFTQDALNAYALTVANEVMDFYGMRHYYFNLQTFLTDDMYDWELLDLIDLNDERYFILSSDINETDLTANFELVSVTGYDYDFQQARAILSASNYNSTLAGVATSPAGTGTNVSISAQLPLLFTGGILSLDYTTNFKKTLNKFDAIQGIKITDTPQFARIGLGGVADSSYKIKNYGDEWIVGNQKIDGMQSIGGAADTNFKQKIYGNQKITGNITVDGDIYIGGVINEVNQVNLNIVDHIFNLNKSGDNTTALDGGIQMLGAGDAVLGSIKYEGTEWLSDLNFNLSSGKVYKINAVEVLSNNTLGSGVVNSSLTSIGTLNHDLNIANTKVYKINSTEVLSATTLGSYVVNSSLTSIGTLNHDLNIANTKVYKINTTQVLSSTALGSTVVNSSLTSVGTLITGVWTASVINALYLNFNTTNLKNSSNALNTIQDISSTSSPTFSNITITNNLTAGFVNSNLIPLSTDTYDLGSSTKLWRKGWLSEMEAILFAKNTITLLGGWFYVTKNAGTLPSDINNSQTQIDLGTTLNYGDYIIFRQPLTVEYMIVGSNVSGTTYNVGRDLDGTGANAWAAGTPFAVFGQNGDGRIELNAYDTPRISLIKQGTTYNSQTEIIRIGDLNGMPTYSTQKWGVYFGDSTQYLKYDKETGALVIAGNGNALDISSNTTISGINSTLTTYGTSITANANAIALKASQSDLNTLTGRVTTAEASIVVNANAIALKASQSDLNTLTGRVTTAEASIVVNANAIALKASQTGLDTLTGRVTTAESNITVNANNIALKVSTTDYTGATIASKLNLTSHSINMSALNIDLTGIVTFSSFDTTTANTINGKTNSSDVTTIIGNTVTTSFLNAKSITALGAVTAGTFSLGSGAFSVDANGKLTSTSASIANWDVNSTAIYKTFNSGSNQSIVTLYGSLTYLTAGLQIISNLVTSGPVTQLITTVGSYNDGGYMRTGFSLWDAVNNAWLMNVGYGTGVMVANVAGWNFTKDYFNDSAQKIYISSLNTSIYIRPLTGLTKFVMVGQTYYGGTYASPATGTWTSHYGISAIDNSNRWMFILDDQYTMLAGWTFDYQKLTVGTSAEGMSLNTSSTPFIANSGTGFEVWDTSSPKMMIGVKNSTGTALTSGFDWNMTISNELTVVGNVVGSSFSTINSLDTTTIGKWVIIKTGTNAGSVWASTIATDGATQGISVLHGGGLTCNNQSNNNNVQINIFNTTGSYMVMDGCYIPKFLGVTNSPTGGLNPGDSRFNTSGKYLVWYGSAWSQIN
jgi:hypothetical protein